MTPEARRLALDLELLSNGSVTAWGSSHGKAKSKPPTGESMPPHLEFLADYHTAPGPESRRRVMAHWREELRRHRGRSRVVAVGDGTTEDDWILKEGTGWSAEDVARRFRCTQTRVRKLRLTSLRNAEDGKLLEGRTDATLRERAQAMRAEGLTQAQIGLRLGVSQATVSRLLSGVRLLRAA